MVVLDVDHRETSSGVPDLLMTRGASVRLANLKAGDYAFGRGFGIDRKRSDDFARSLVDGRLFEQAGALRRCYARPIVILEGFWPGQSVLGVQWPQLRGALVSLSAAFGIPVLPTSGPQETAEVILAAVRHGWLRGDSTHRNPTPRRASSKLDRNSGRGEEAAVSTRGRTGSLARLQPLAEQLNRFLANLGVGDAGL